MKSPSAPLCPLHGLAMTHRLGSELSGCSSCLSLLRREPPPAPLELNEAGETPKAQGAAYRLGWCLGLVLALSVGLLGGLQLVKWLWGLR